MKIRYSKKALKFLAKQEKATVTRIRDAIVKLTHTPPEGDIKELQGVKDKMRLRVGGFRIIYSNAKETAKDGKQVEILNIEEIGNRGDIYK